VSRDAQGLYAAYEEWAKRSGEWIEEGRRVFPGGDTRMSAHYAPYPVFMESGQGCRIVDVDGHEYVDFMNNFTSLIHGHAHPATVAAVSEQMTRGSAYAAPTRSQIELARLIVERVPSIEQLRFTSSGSEATLMALRAARAFTGRERILKIEGGYHGSYELAEVSLVPWPDRAGPLDKPESLPIDASIPQSVLEDTVVAPYNRPEIAARLIAEHANELAAVIVEPMLGSMGMIPASADFMSALREETQRHGVLLILDEVITLRLAPGGAQSLLGVTPDLTAMGKIIGGGLPIGGVGGREDVMQVFNPDRPDAVMHASTFSGNPLSMAAGAAALAEFDAEAGARLNALGDRLRDGFNSAFRASPVRGQAVGRGSLVQLHLGDAPITDARDAFAAMHAAGGTAARLLHLGLLRRGVFSAARLMHCVSTPMGEAEIDVAPAALADALDELAPVLQTERPALLR
jgi:glutamate-1-semialdehyde 2,1-aminomutase